MNLWNLLNALDMSLRPERTKIHLAGDNGVENPLDVYRGGTFHDWHKALPRGATSR